MSQEQLAALVREAGQAATAGQWAAAERLWAQVRALEPNHVQALFSLGVHAHQKGNQTEALELLNTAKRAAPRDPMIRLSLSVVFRSLGDSGQEWGAIMEALALDPYFLPGLLSKAEFLERTGKSRAAAAVYGDAMKVAPPEPQWPPALFRRLAHARDMVRRDMDELAQFLGHQVAAEHAAIEQSAKARWSEAISIMAGATRPFRSECNQLHVPRLPAHTFYDPELFPWIPALEAQTQFICEELIRVLADQSGAFVPYVAYRPGEPVNQWKDLNHSLKWSSFHLWAHGVPQTENLAKCPKTAAALAEVDSASVAGMCPNAMFSVLAPRTVIPPHHGETNARLVAHLPLIIPRSCELRVGFDRRKWTEGKVVVFDDTIEHAARNDSDDVRTVLIFDVWNPYLSAGERLMVSALTAAMRDYRSRSDAS